MKKYCCLLIILLAHSCKKQCNVQKIDKSVLNISLLKGDYIIENQKKEVDSLLLIDFADELVNEKISSPTRHDECGHFIFYRYSFKNETIDLRLKKDEQSYMFSIFGGTCDSKDIILNYQQIKQHSIIKINLKKCKESELKTLVFKIL